MNVLAKSTIPVPSNPIENVLLSSGCLRIIPERVQVLQPGEIAALRQDLGIVAVVALCVRGESACTFSCEKQPQQIAQYVPHSPMVDDYWVGRVEMGGEGDVDWEEKETPRRWDGAGAGLGS